MAKKKLLKSKTNFTLKRLHQSGSYGTIYERDYATIAKTGKSPEGQIPTYGNPTFKLSVRGGYNGKKKYRQGNWILNEADCSSGHAWTLGCMPVANNNDSKIITKPNSKKITDFAYFGSAYELIKASIHHIVCNFPGELYVSEKTINSTGILLTDDIPSNSDIKNGGYGNYLLVENPFLINITQRERPSTSIVSSLRYMCETFDKYMVINNNGVSTNIHSWEVMSSEVGENNACLANGTHLANVYFKDESGKSIIMVNCFNYNNSIILLCDSKYRNYRIRPQDNVVNEFFDGLDDFEKTILNQYTNYTAKFEKYTETDDDGWVMTEEDYSWPVDNGGWNIAINGLGYTKYANELYDLSSGYDILFTDMIWRTMTHEAIINMDFTYTSNGEDIDNNGSSKVKMMFAIIGRLFDELKKYADNIKRSNTITYDSLGNMPDYFVSDNLELSGWETKHILKETSADIFTDPMYGARTIGYCASDANNEFMKRLKLNSKYILRKKGTKQAIEDLMAVFGFHSTDWIRKKYYNNAKGITESDNLLRTAFIMYEYSYVVNGYHSNNSGTTLIDNVKRINQLKDSYPDDLINNDMPIDEFHGLPVARVEDGEGNATLIPWFDKDLEYDGDLYFHMKGGWSRFDKDDGTYEYERTVSRIHLVDTLTELYELPYYKIDETGLYYVTQEQKYFKVKDIEEHSNAKGWYTQEQISEKEIYEAESIIEDSKGNNPHTGDYDGGSTYLESYAKLFTNATFNNARKDETEDIIDEYGFNIVRQTDSTKTVALMGKEIDGILRSEHKVKPINLFTNNVEFSEMAGTSIMNNKEFHIIFDDAHKEFIENDILPYVKQLIPSTTIFSYSFEHLTGDETNKRKAYAHQIVCDGQTCPIYGIV